MQLVLIRHARAEERALFKRDRTRALTEDGRRRMRKAARGLHAILPGLTHIATSPFLRARQTAEIVAAVYAGVDIVLLPALSPGATPRAVLAWLRTQLQDTLLALVGHEPDLGRLASWLLAGRSSGFVQFKKGAAALIEFADAPAAGKGTLVWLLTAAQLAELKGCDMKAPALLALPPELAVQRLALAQLDAALTASARFTNRDDAEALHDFRVALRRLRSVLRAYAPWYDVVPKNLHKCLRRLAHATNAARDTEVQIEWLRRVQPRLKAGARSGLTWLITRLAKRQRMANRAVRKLAHKDFAALEPRLRAALRTRKQGRDAGAGVTFAQAADECLSVYCAELAADLASIDSAADREEIHVARISGKRLRYLLEPLRGSVPGVAVLANSMQSFQDRFGELTDRFVMAREIAQAVEIAGAQAEQVLPGLLELAAWVERDAKRRHRDIRARYLGRRAHKLLAPMRAMSRKLTAANDS